MAWFSSDSTGANWHLGVLLSQEDVGMSTITLISSERFWSAFGYSLGAQPSGNESCEPVLIGPSKAFGSLVVVSAGSADRSECDLVSEYKCFVESIQSHLRDALALRKAGESDNSSRGPLKCCIYTHLAHTCASAGLLQIPNH